MAQGTRRTGAGRRGRPSLLSSISTADLRRELERRQSAMLELIKQRDALSAELQELESVFGGGGAPVAMRERSRAAGGPMAAPRGRRGRRGPRPRNATNLVEALRGVLADKTMSVTDVAAAVQEAGYKTNSANFRTIVNQALLANPKVFRKVDRGQYTAK